jgi:hypothetical protein
MVVREAIDDGSNCSSSGAETDRYEEVIRPDKMERNFDELGDSLLHWLSLK